MKLGFRSKILLFVFIPVTIISFVSYLVSHHVTVVSELNSTDQYMSAITARLADKINYELLDIERITKDGAEYVAKSDFVSSEEAYEYLAENLNKNMLIVGSRFSFELSYNHGVPRINTVHIALGEIRRRDLSPLEDYTRDTTLSWYHEPLKTHKGFWDKPFVDNERKIVCVRYSYPIIKNGKFIGVASARVNLSYIGSFKDTTVYKNLNYVVISGDGMFIYHPDKRKIVSANIFTVKSSSIHTGDQRNEGIQMLKGKPGKTFLRMANDPGKRLIAYYHPVSATGWSLGVSVPEDELLAVTTENTRTSVIILVLTFIFLFGVILWLSNTITKPIKFFADKVARFSKEKHFEPIQITSGDELEVLGNAFNEMAEEVKRREAELERLNESLEGKVEQRTKDLASTLAEVNELNKKLVTIDTALNLATVVSYSDIKGNITYVNDEFCRVSKYSRDELIGQNHKIINSGYHSKAFWADLWQTIQQGKIWRAEVRDKAKDGTVYWVDSLIIPIFDNEGKPQSYFCIRFDITERKLAEAELEKAKEMADKMIDSSPIPTAVTKIEGGDILRANRAMLEFHCVDEDSLKKMKASGWYANPDERLKLIGILTKVGYVYNHEVQFKRFATGEIRDAYVSFIPIIYNGMNCLVGSIVDITDIKKIQTELAGAKEAAEAATVAKSQFLATMSHEIRTPMNAIIGLSNLTLKTELTIKQQDYLTKIERSAQALLGIINDILDFSKIEAGKLQTEYVDFDLDQVLDTVSNLISQKANEKGLEFSIHISNDVPFSLRGDPLRITQILANYCSNAVKFTEHGDIAVDVCVDNDFGDKTALKFSVRDTGIGLTEEQKPKIFASFSQADSSTTRKYGGTGLGLSICKRLAELMGGRAWVESEIGEGSTFYFTAILGIQKHQKKDEYITSVDLTGLDVLVCDDNSTARKILKEALESFSFKVSIVTSGNEAVKLVKEKQFKLILMDWRMPGLNGIETSKLLLDQNAEHPPKIILVTAFGGEEVTAEAHAAGIQSVLQKPVTHSTLFDAIMELFGKDARTRRASQEKGSKYTEALRLIRGAKILLTEDNEINQQVATELLEQAGFIIEIANNGKECCEKVFASGVPSKYDLILMDLQMPVMDGYTASEEIRKNPDYNDVPIVAMTADAMVGIKEKCYAAGMADYVTKPIDIDDVFGALVKWIRPGERSTTEVKTESGCKAEQAVEEIPSLQFIDTATGLMRVAGNKKLYLSLLAKFHDAHGSVTEQIQDAVSKNDKELAVRLSHTVKGVAGNIGAGEVGAAAAKLEMAFLKSDLAGNSGLIQEFDAALTSVISELHEWLETRPKEEVFVDEGGELDMARLGTLLGELKDLLNQSDFTSSGKIKELLSLPGIAGIKDGLGLLEQHVKSYDFDEALKTLETVREKLDKEV